MGALPITWFLVNSAAIIGQMQQVFRLIISCYEFMQAVDALGTISVKGTDDYSCTKAYIAWADKWGFTIET